MNALFASKLYKKLEQNDYTNKKHWGEEVNVQFVESKIDVLRIIGGLKYQTDKVQHCKLYSITTFTIIINIFWFFTKKFLPKGYKQAKPHF